MTRPLQQPALTLEQFSHLLASLYRGPLETTPWQTFLSALRQALQVEGAILILRHPSASDLGAIITEGFPELSSRRDTLYSQRLYAMDRLNDELAAIYEDLHTQPPASGSHTPLT